jgi:hypothetical protein
VKFPFEKNSMNSFPFFTSVEPYKQLTNLLLEWKAQARLTAGHGFDFIVEISMRLLRTTSIQLPQFLWFIAR